MKNSRRTIWRAWYESRSFDFEAYAATKPAAKTALLRALNEHGSQYNLDDDWFEADDIGTLSFDLGAGYRDQTEIVEAK